MANVDRSKIENHMPIVGSDGKQIGTVDHLDPGNSIKVTRDNQGQHHWVPLSWVDRVDQYVHLGRSAGEATSQWMTSPPAMSSGQGPSSEASASH